ncbi:ankyrin repeat-containing domain protein [Cercophora newfieldiana]|uniref:Ankyrin repeat-containing domain protein n=1 Tax=Cercophora newfieldiana TaxID=92897 RepID=A0AA40CRR7_9PEZI|nr:ankyrin repeat-containing domain protein [Cercophora newfieldiana]
MDPLSAIASVIAISQALGAGIKALNTLTNAPVEFSDMLSELSSLQACTSQLCSVMGTMSDPRLSLPSEVIGRLQIINFELGQIQGTTRDIEARVLRGKQPISRDRKGAPKLSIINWQKERGKAIKLRDRAKRCRDDLVVCLGLLGVSEQLQQRNISAEILAFSQSQHLMMQTFLTRLDGLETILIATPTKSLEAPPEAQEPVAPPSNATVHTRSARQQYAVRVANTVEDFRLVEFLLELGFSPLFVDYTGESPASIARRELISCTTQADMSFARPILQKIANADIDHEDFSTLIVDTIIERTNLSLEKAIAMEPCQINAVDSSGHSPLHWAAYFGYIDKARTLIQHGATLELRTKPRNLTALHIATIQDNASLASLLLEAGADLEARDADGCTPLHYCSDIATTRILIAAGANANVTCSDGSSVLHHLSSGDYVETEGNTVALCVSELVAAGADLNLHSAIGWTPVLSAASRGHATFIAIIHSLGGRLDIPDQYGGTVLSHICYLYGYREIEFLRNIAICGIDPDLEVEGCSDVDDFESRMYSPWNDLQTRPTQADVFSFYALVHELRQRNWEAGLFLYSKEKLEAEGKVDQLRRWLGWQWQRMYDDKSFGQYVWDPDEDEYPDECEYHDDDTDYDTFLLFGGLDEFDPCCWDRDRPPVFLGENNEEDEDEFFDALS